MSVPELDIKRGGPAVKLTANSGTNSFITGNIFDSITAYTPHVGFEFVCTGNDANQVASRNTFVNCIAQADQTQTTGQLAMINGFKDISNKNNAFFHGKSWM